MTNRFIALVAMTLVSAGSIADTSPLDKFVDYWDNGTNGVFILNTNCWAHGIDTSCASMWNSFDKNKRAGTAISKRHVIAAAHYPIGIGAKLVFCGNDGSVCTNRVTGSRVVMGTDILVLLMQDELPNVVTPAYLLPTNFQEYIWTGLRLPVIRFDQDERCIINEISQPLPAPHSPRLNDVELFVSQPDSPARQAFYDYLRVLDSGNPIFLIMGRSAVLLGTGHFGYNMVSPDVYQTTSAPFVTYYAEEIQAAMDSLAPGYSLTFVDLSHYAKVREDLTR